MNTVARKIAIACFIGGVLCAGFAFFFTPNFLLFSVFVGMLGGYVSYEFRETCHTVLIGIPKTIVSVRDCVIDRVTGIRRFIGKPRPFLHIGGVVTLPFTLPFVTPFFSSMVISYIDQFDFVSMIMLLTCIVITIETAFLIAVFGTLPVLIFAFTGARLVEKCYWFPTFDLDGIESSPYWSTDTKEEKKRVHLKELEELEKSGIRRKPRNYTNVVRWTIEGAFALAPFLVWVFLKYAAIGVWLAVRAFVGSLRNMFNHVHRNKRILCALYGTIGGVLSYVGFREFAVAFVEKLFVIIGGGCIGAALGILIWSLIERRKEE